MKKRVGRLVAYIAFGSLAAVCLSTPAQSAAPPCELQLIEPSGSAEDDQFGNFVSMSGDTAVVGSVFHSGTAGADQGQAHVFRRIGLRWIQEATLIPDEPSAGALFGGPNAVDGERIACSAIFEQSGTGAVYLFERVGGVWMQSAKVVAPDGSPGDEFGTSIALQHDRLYVGAYRDDGTAGQDQGSVYVFHEQAPHTWVLEAKLIPGSPFQMQRFGHAVAIDNECLVVGATAEFAGPGLNTGSAVVFRRTGTSWSQEAELLAPDAQPEDYFGRSVAVFGDLAIVGAPWTDDAGSLTGACYVFRRRSDGVWLFEARLAHPAPAAGNRFGVSLDLDGNLATIGAFGASTGGVSAQGSVSMFRRDNGQWQHRATTTANASAAGDNLGYSLASNGEVVLAGAPLRAGVGGGDSGAVIVFNVTECAEPRCPGDFNNNGVTGLDDLALIIQNWGESCP